MTEPGQPLRVVLADDHAVVRKGIREFLETGGSIAVVAEAADGNARTRRTDRRAVDHSIRARKRHDD
jgi:DNA-binding NarL/FixJ family response regulator